MHFPEAALQRAQIVETAKRLDGLDLAAVGLNRERAAGTGRQPVEKNGASAANAVLAAYMRAGQPDLVADEVGQQQPWLDPPLKRPAVYRDIDVLIVHRAGHPSIV